MNQKLKSVLIWVAIFLVTIFAWNVFKGSDEPEEWRGYETFTADLKADEVAQVQVLDGYLKVSLWNGESYATQGIVDDQLIGTLSSQGVEISWGEERAFPWTSILLTWAPVLLIVALWLFFMKRMGGGGGTNILQLRKSTARILEEKAKATFADVGGCAEAKEQLGDVVAYLRDPKPWAAAGARLPRGILLEGPPGCGKTLLARAVAGETGAKFYVVAASEFVEMFVGVGAARVRDLFEIARKTAPAVVFIDELDAVGRRRGSGIGASHDEREQTLNQLLVSLDGLERSEGVVVIAATNRPDVLDPALLRPGRMDRRVMIALCDKAERREILDIHVRGKNLDGDVDLDSVAEETHGRSGADLESLVNEATVIAVRRSAADGSATKVGRQDFECALKERCKREQTFDRLDMVLVESASQLSESTGVARARFVLTDGADFVGEPVWADSVFIKVRAGDGTHRVIAKRQIQQIETLEGTETVERSDVSADRWAGRAPDMA